MEPSTSSTADLGQVVDAVLAHGLKHVVIGQPFGAQESVQELSVIDKQRRRTFKHLLPQLEALTQSTHDEVEHEDEQSRRQSSRYRRILTHHGVLDRVADDQQSNQVERLHLADGFALACNPHQQQQPKVDQASAQRHFPEPRWVKHLAKHVDLLLRLRVGVLLRAIFLPIILLATPWLELLFLCSGSCNR